MISHILAGLILAGTVAAFTIPEPPITGPAQVTDGDTLRINNHRIRLFGIDAPERDQPFGPAATAYLQRQVLNVDVSCYPRDTDKWGRVVAKCFVAGRDLGAALVANGLAVDYARYSGGAYRDHETAARQERLGIWSDPNMIRPEKWRREHRPY